MQPIQMTLSQVWRECWPKDLTGASWWRAALGSPKVHSGFYHAYTASGFNMELMGRLKRILRSLVEYEPGRRVRVFVTGHSLGGALATLCAYDVMTHCQRDHFEDYNVSCYTFGAPRTGNHAFARLLMDKVPDTWHVINSDDTVTRVGKFFFLFKRGGHRVLINPRGDLIVRPDYIEQYVLRRPGSECRGARGHAFSCMTVWGRGKPGRGLCVCVLCGGGVGCGGKGVGCGGEGVGCGGGGRKGEARRQR